jgi:TRAP-type C4-dicarboxylate transport system permease small subunit
VTEGGLVDRLDAVVERLARWAVYAGCVAVVGILVLLAGSSVKRYILGTPIPVTEELTALFFVAVSFCSMPHGFCARRQIRLLLIWRRLPPRFAGWCAILGDLAATAVLVLISVQLIRFTRFSWDVGALSEVADLRLWPWMALMPAMLLLFALAILARTLVNVRDILAARSVRLEEGSSVD